MTVQQDKGILADNPITVQYDDADCDGYCLLNDITVFLEEIEPIKPTFITYERQQEVLHSPFDVRIHKETFINYLEVVLLPDGTVEYAVPAHVQKLAQIYGKPMDELFEEYQENHDFTDPVEYLCKKTGCISVWTNGYTGKPNAVQLETLRKLKRSGVYTGEL